MRRQTGFSLTELLIVMAVIGILSTIAVPTLLSAIYRGKQKRTMADMRTISAAVTAYAVDTNHAPIQPTAGSISGISVTLQPTYVKVLPILDAWDHDFQYASGALADDYTVLSFARDGVVSGPASGPTTGFDDDITISQGAFISWPEGTQDK